VPLWPALVNYLFAPAPPAATGSMHVKSSHRTKPTTQVTARWGAHQAKRNGSAPRSALVQITRDSNGKHIFTNKHARPSGSHRFGAVPGASYTMTVVIRDLAGQRSAPIKRHIVVPKQHS
jgi:hypothetical protein